MAPLLLVKTTSGDGLTIEFERQHNLSCEKNKKIKK